MVSPKFILASRSPRRRQILEMAGLEFEVRQSDVDETSKIEDPVELATHLAESKAKAVSASGRDQIVLAADTVVAHDGMLLGKPVSEAEATEMLESLSGQTHLVVTAVSVINSSGNQHTDAKSTNVTFRKLSKIDVENYVRTGLPMDKAGGYGIQDSELDPVEKYESCYLNVVGLPLCTTVDLLRRAGLTIEQEIMCEHSTYEESVAGSAK
ncbi:MAG: Maf family protein [Dehalococcoidia bacterium]